MSWAVFACTTLHTWLCISAADRPRLRLTVPPYVPLNDSCCHCAPAEVAAHVWRAPGVVQELPDGARKPIMEPPSKVGLCLEGSAAAIGCGVAWRGLALPARGMPARTSGHILIATTVHAPRQFVPARQQSLYS